MMLRTHGTWGTITMICTVLMALLIIFVIAQTLAFADFCNNPAYQQFIKLRELGVGVDCITKVWESWIQNHIYTPLGLS